MSLEKAQVIHWSDLSRPPTRSTLRQFAILWMAFFLFLAVRHGVLGERPILGLVAALLAVTVGPLGLIRPQTLRVLFVGWMMVVFPIGWVMSRLVLALVFYGLFTPIALFFRLIGRDLLALRRPVAVETYWEPKPQPVDTRSYLRQF
jgi:hypothetical protein